MIFFNIDVFVQVSKGVMTYVTQEVKDLYHLMEHEFIPLDMTSKVQPLLTKVSKLGGKLTSASSVPEVQLAQYIPALEKLATLRLLQQVNISFLFHFFLLQITTCLVHGFHFALLLFGFSGVPGVSDHES